MEKIEKGLMKKTKKELVDIILRKDEEEKSLKNSLSDATNRCNNLEKKLNASIKDCEGMEKSLNDAHTKYNELKEKLNRANENVEQHRRGMDNVVTENQALKKRNKTLSNWCAILAIAVIIMGIVALAF